MKIIPRADFKENWIKHNPILDKDELAIILTNATIPTMVVGDGKTPAIKCKNISPFAYVEIIKENGINKFYLHKSQEDYKWVKQFVKDRNKNEEST